MAQSCFVCFCLLCYPLFVFLSLSILLVMLTYTLMELILPLATCHCTFVRMPTTTYRRQASAAGGLWSSNHAGPYRPGKNSEWVQWNDQNDEGREWGLERGCRELPQPGPGRSPGHTPYQHFLNVTERFRWKENATFLLNMVTILTTAITPSPPLNAALRSRAPVSVLSTRRHAKYFRRPHAT